MLYATSASTCSPAHLRDQAELLRTAGDVFVRDGDAERALLFYDAAIDMYLRAGDTATASQLCEAVVRVAPNGVRARCTLAWLAVLLGRADATSRRIAEYAEAAEAAGMSDRACRQLRCMAEECDAPPVLEVIADSLLHLGDSEAANRVYGRIYARNIPARVYASPADHARVVAARLTMAITV
jgi:tetratricopeptide (TPR) repeat protein